MSLLKRKWLKSPKKAKEVTKKRKDKVMKNNDFVLYQYILKENIQ